MFTGEHSDDRSGKKTDGRYSRHGAHLTGRARSDAAADALQNRRQAALKSCVK
jgi:hypothetical protein